jgi:hypothetical protein
VSRLILAAACFGLACLAPTSALGAVPPCSSEASRHFQRYDLGQRPDDLALVGTFRRCARPYPGEQIRANFYEYQYARCNDCDVRLSVQNWPACERGRADVTAVPPGGLQLPEMQRLTLRHVPALYFPGDRRLELYTGRTTVVLFGPDLATLRRAAAKLRARRGVRPRVGPGERLPPPLPGALEGRLRCVRAS